MIICWMLTFVNENNFYNKDKKSWVSSSKWPSIAGGGTASEWYRCQSKSHTSGLFSKFATIWFEFQLVKVKLKFQFWKFNIIHDNVIKSKLKQKLHVLSSMGRDVIVLILRPLTPTKRRCALPVSIRWTTNHQSSHSLCPYQMRSGQFSVDRSVRNRLATRTGFVSSGIVVTSCDRAFWAIPYVVSIREALAERF